MNRTTVLVVVACVVALGTGIAAVRGESQTAERLISSTASASGSLPSHTAASRIDTGTEDVLRPTVSVRTETPVYHAPSTSGGSTGSTQAERDAALRASTAAKRAAFDRANGYPTP